jgi:hypothetical protein
MLEFWVRIPLKAWVVACVSLCCNVLCRAGGVLPDVEEMFEKLAEISLEMAKAQNGI